VDGSVQYSALDLFKALVDKKHGYYEARKAAVEGMNSNDYRVRSSALNLFKALTEKGQQPKEVIKYDM